MSTFSFGSPAPAPAAGGGGFGFGAAAGTPASAAAATPGGPVQTPTAASAAATNTATKGVSFSFASPGPTFGATPASTAGAGAGAATPGGFASPPASAGTGTTAAPAGGLSATPAGVANPLLRNAGVTPGLSRGSGGGGGMGGMSGASPASFLSPGIGGGGAGGSSSGRVTFADDSTGILGGGGLRRRRGGVGEKENVVGNHHMATMPLGGGIRGKAPPKASLLSLSPMMMGGGGALGDKMSGVDAKSNGSSVAPAAASAVRERSLIPAAHIAPYNPNPYASWVVVYGYANSAQLNTVLNRFGTYGTILAHHGGGGGGIGGGAGADSASSSSSAKSNWVCLRYETPLQAEKAICQHGTLLDGGNPSAGEGMAIGGAGGRNEPLIIVGVMRMDAGVARRLGLAGPEGGVAPPRVSGGRPLIANKTTKALLSEEDILLGGSGAAAGSGSLAAGRSGSVCDKVLGWIFMW
mmetsp:Transcript_33149/g.97791  ORF Transcript_33149/g.97791 Transcript_33149/m.97791 type:complete len:467 (+) Transcript_33149:278-1678(+)